MERGKKKGNLYQRTNRGKRVVTTDENPKEKREDTACLFELFVPLRRIKSERT